MNFEMKGWLIAVPISIILAVLFLAFLGWIEGYILASYAAIVALGGTYRILYLALKHVSKKEKKPGVPIQERKHVA